MGIRPRRSRSVALVAKSTSLAPGELARPFMSRGCRRRPRRGCLCPIPAALTSDRDATVVTASRGLRQSSLTAAVRKAEAHVPAPGRREQTGGCSLRRFASVQPGRRLGSPWGTPSESPAFLLAKRRAGAEANGEPRVCVSSRSSGFPTRGLCSRPFPAVTRHRARWLPRHRWSSPPLARRPSQVVRTGSDIGVEAVLPIQGNASASARRPLAPRLGERGSPVHCPSGDQSGTARSSW